MTSSDVDTSGFKWAESTEEAEQLASTYLSDDPFPSVPRALLSSPEIRDYALVTGMLLPFDENSLKSASYEAHIGGDAIWWDENGIKQQSVVKRGDPLSLKANSITFVQAEPYFRLPNYIAVRFNLRITHVHRGLLLGTGPLVDPGFSGKLLIPLHNLTSDPYELNTDEALIWIEFTKTSFGSRPASSFEFRGFPSDKKDMSPEKYLRRANGPNPIRSSIPVAVHEATVHAKNAEDSASDARSTVEGIQRRITRFGVGAAFVAVITVGLALFGLHVQVRSLVQDSLSLSTAIQRNLAEVQSVGESNQQAVQQIERSLDEARQSISALVADFSNFRQADFDQRIDEFSIEIERINRELDSLISDKESPASE